MMDNKIKKEILKNQDKILSSLNPESLEVYRFLKSEYSKGDIIKNHVFKFTFRSFYRIDNAKFSNKLKDKYFELLSKKEDNLGIILSELHRIPNLKGLNCIHFSFATKLLHTLDNNNPIYDTEVSRVLHITTIKKGTKEVKIKSCEEKYLKLKEIHESLLKDKEIQKLISRFRKNFNVKPEHISDVKVLDFIVWSLGKLKKK